MTKRIQAYFKTEDEAEGAKTSLISYNVEGLEVWPLTDPLERRDRNILMPLVPLNNGGMAGGAFGTLGTGSPGAVAIVPGITDSESLNETDSRSNTNEARDNILFHDSDLDDVHYVMDLKVGEQHYSEVIDVLRGKNGYVEVFD
ncbi:hypothetical protein PaeBR_08250 [Paenibacillus sp. BR2-3]|uniref:hypothetical protein n=1 Tax=Paenibacillus sp. BR2-3 TaxID=3048494 RepID=UPI003977A41E